MSHTDTPEQAAVIAWKGETHQITGKGADRVLLTMPRSFGHHAVLHRSVCGVIRTALVAGWQESILGWWYVKLQN